MFCPSRLFSISLKRSAKSGIATDLIGTSDRTWSAISRSNCGVLCADLEREGFRHVHVFKSPEELEGLEIERQPMWTNRRTSTGPSTSSATCMAALMS